MDKHTRVNLGMWNRLVGVNLASELYDVEGFKAGKSKLSPEERGELGPLVRGKEVVHLQCHFGMDTLSIARLGASRVVGVDFSLPAVRAARRLAKEVGLAPKSKFICSDVYVAPKRLPGRRFDVVYTGRGALCWLRDLGRWGKVVAKLLKPGGVLYLMEFHPFSNMLDEDAAEMRFRYPYLHEKEPVINKFRGTYSEPGSDFEGEEHNWGFGLGQLVDAISDAGLRVDFLHEFDWVDYKRFPFLSRRRDGHWSWKDSSVRIPLQFSLKAHRD